MPPLLTAIVASACLGALVGLIRQWSDQKTASGPVDFGGVRTYTFWAMLGCVGAFVTELTSPALIAVLFGIVGAQQIVAKFNAPGGTTFASTLLTVLTGCLVYWEELPAAVLVAATTMVLLGSKQPLHEWTRTFTRDDVRGTLQFVAITGVILPLVPNRDLGPFEAFNPFSTWLMVVLISGLGFAGYLAMRLLGAGAGLLATSLLGGLASSTASTLAFTRRSREEPELAGEYALAVAIACTVMLPRVLVAIAVINTELASNLVAPFACMAVPGVIFGVWLWWRQRRTGEAGAAVRLRNPLDLKTAIKFAILYAVIAF
ncbi:MAG TPA: MgtC/SapB family protein, partial [Opitutus sp.]|nr:MgtC/SapB family protein [Opitutus sp.]